MTTIATVFQPPATMPDRAYVRMMFWNWLHGDTGEPELDKVLAAADIDTILQAAGDVADMLARDTREAMRLLENR